MIHWCQGRDQWIDAIKTHLDTPGVVIVINHPDFAIDLRDQFWLTPYHITQLHQWPVVYVSTSSQLEDALVAAVTQTVFLHGFVEWALGLVSSQITTALNFLGNTPHGYVCESELIEPEATVDNFGLAVLLATLVSKWVTNT